MMENRDVSPIVDFSALTLHQLRILRSVGRLGNLTKAAAEMGISQPAVSIQIKHLERLLGFPIIRSNGRRIELTDLGLVVDEHGSRVLTEVENLSAAILAARGLELGSLVVGADTTVGIYVMPQLLGAWLQDHQNISVDLRVGNHEELSRLIRNNEVDLAVVSAIPDIPRLHVEEYMPNRLVVIAPPEHRWATHSGTLKMQAVAREPFLVRELGSSTRATMEAYCDQVGVRLNIAMQLGSIGAIKQGVSSGLGLGVVSERAVGNELAVGALVILDVEGFPLELPWHIVHSEQKRMAPSAKSFMQFLIRSRSVFQEPEFSRAPSQAVPRRLRRKVEA
jgi:DNA-binding transcriptional LysR family regulator